MQYVVAKHHKAPHDYHMTTTRHSQQVLTAMQPVIDILELEYLKAEKEFYRTGKYVRMADIAYTLHSISNFGWFPYYPNKAFTIWN